MKNIGTLFQSQEKKSSSIDSLEITSDQERRKVFLQYVNRAWLALGIVTLLTLPIFPTERDVFSFIIAATISTYLITSLIIRLGRLRLAGTIFTLSLNFSFYGLFLLLVHQMGASEAFNSQVSVWMLMGLAVLFAGAFIDKWAAPGLALINTVLLIGTRLTLAPSSQPRPSALVFWWMMALTIWLYERTLGEASRRILAELEERKQTDENLRQAEAKYRTLVEQIPPIVYISDPDQHIGVTYISPQIKTLGFTEEEWVSDPELWFRQIHPDDQAKVMESIEFISQVRDPYKLEYRLRTRDGRMRWFLDEVMDVVDNDGKILFRQGFMLDITEHKQAEEELRESEANLRRAQKIAHVGHWVWDTQTNQVSLSDEMYEILGLRHGLFTTNILDMIQQTTHPDDIERVLSILEKTTRDQNPTGIEYRIVQPDKTIHHIWAEPGDQVMDESGKILKLSGIVQDITERTLAEKTLKESEERFRLLSEVSREGIQIHEKGVVVDANLALAKQLGYLSPDEIIGKQIMQKHLTPESFERVTEVITHNSEVTYEVEGIRNNGTHFPVEITSYLLNIKGKDLRIASTRDITERKQAENALQENEYKLRTIFETMSEGVALNEIIYDENGEMIDYRILEVNQAYYSTAGYSNQDVIGKLASDIYGMSPEFIKSFWKTHRNQNKVQHTELPSPISDKWFYISTSPFTNNRFVTSFFDITERKRVEQEIYRRERFLGLLNKMTQVMLTARNFEELAQTLTTDITIMLEADQCYITRWDPTQEQVFPVAANAKLSKPYITNVFEKGKENLTTSALNAGKIIVAEDIENSPDTNKELVKNFPVKSAISIPLIYGENKLGAVIAGFEDYHHFVQEELDRAQLAGNQIALVIWNMQQEIELQRSLREEQALASIAMTLSQTERIGLDNVLNLIVTSAQSLIANAEQVVIHLLDEKEKMLTSAAAAGFSHTEAGSKKIRSGVGIAGQVILSGETINIADVNNDARFLKLEREPSYRSLLVSPVQSGVQKLGTISIQSNLPYAFTPNDIKLLEQLSTQAAIAIENANLLEATNQALNESNALFRVNRGLVASLDPNELLKDTVELLQKNFGYHYVQIYVADAESGDFVMHAGSGDIGAQLKSVGHRLSAGEGIVGYTAETDAAFFTNNVDDMVSFVRNPLLPDTKSELTVPVKAVGKILGLLDIHQIPPKYLTERDIQLVSAVADQLAVALQKADLYETLQASLQQEKATRDQLVQNERLAVMGRLLATVSHELNNPLQAIQNALFLLREENSISLQGRQDLEIVLAESERMANMIERLRATYRPIQADEFVSTQVNNLIEDVYALISTHLRQNKIVFEFHPDPELPSILALADQIRQVLLNLLMNAVESMTSGGKLTISTNLLQDSNEILFTVLDSGPGIEPDLLQNIFNPFITNKQKGTGLGLTISYDIVMKHHGRITAENNSDENMHGALFKVWLPIQNMEIQ